MKYFLSIVMILLIQPYSFGHGLDGPYEKDHLIQKMPEMVSNCQKSGETLIDTGVTALMVDGIAQERDCLKRLAARYLLEFYSEDFFEPDIETYLNSYLKKEMDLYSTVFTLRKQCSDGEGNYHCGTMYYTYPIQEQINSLKKLLETVGYINAVDDLDNQWHKGFNQ